MDPSSTHPHPNYVWIIVFFIYEAPKAIRNIMV